ncbi:Cytochrome P450 [Penicillium taxi]|uniref:Cytochrome P450 n=1 Tax=Penicillium taxi TaxID=168475 RepID=UPI0025452C81|nr:Cytochrome P450 [Penicillium taxi]KAJ5900141.1 Cytochrome P450 [Penicillium taxi]
MCTQGLYGPTMISMFNAAEEEGISCSWIGTIPVIYLRDPEIIRHVLVANSDCISRQGSNGRGPFGIMTRMTGEVPVTAEGENWRRWRASLLKGFNRTQSLKNALPGIVAIADRHVQRLLQKKEGSDIRSDMEQLALDAAWYISLGVDDMSDSSAELLSIMSRYVELVGNPSHLWRHAVRNMISAKKFEEPDSVESKVGKDISGFVETLVEKYSHLIDPENESDGQQVFNILRQISKESGGTADCPITSDVLTQARQIFSLGHEAPTLVLFWSICELNLHPEIVTQLRGELMKSGWDKENPDYHMLINLPHLDHFLNEILRVHPPISTTARIVTNQFNLVTRSGKAVTLPERTQIFSSVQLLHLDPNVWGSDADKFHPDRWGGLLPNSLESRCEYLPFLAGPRRCTSSNFVLIEMKAILAVLLSEADISILDAASVTPKLGGVTRSTFPVEFQVKPYVS